MNALALAVLAPAPPPRRVRVAEMLRPEHVPLMTAAELLRFNSLALSDDLGLFVREAWPVLEPATPFIPGQHIDAIVEQLEAVSRGEETREIFNVPPGMSKTLVASVFWPAWEWTWNPASRWIFASYAADLAIKSSIDRRTLISSRWYQARWGDKFRLSSDQNVKSEFQNTARGVMRVCGIGGAITGYHGTRIVIDDPHNPKGALSDMLRQQAIDFFRYTLSTRLDDPKTGAIVLIMQRLHELDLTGYLLTDQPALWKTLCLPMRAEAGDPLGRAEGELLCPERFDETAVAALEKLLGSYGASGQLQQRPSPASGGMLKRGWWNEYEVPPADMDEVLLSWDCAFKETKDTDFVVGQAWGKKGGNFYLLDQTRDRMDFPATCRAIESLSAKWPRAAAKLVEDKANGPAVISTLKNKIPGLIPIEPRGSKVARASAASPVIEAGNVFLPSPSIAPWVHDFIEECAAFPKGANDDQVDAMTQALDRMLGGLAFDLEGCAAEDTRAADKRLLEEIEEENKEIERELAEEDADEDDESDVEAWTGQRPTRYGVRVG